MDTLRARRSCLGQATLSSLGLFVGVVACGIDTSPACGSLFCSERGYQVDITRSNGDPLPRTQYEVQAEADDYEFTGECDLRDGGYCDLQLMAAADSDSDEEEKPPITARFFRVESTGRLRFEIVESYKVDEFGSKGGPSVVKLKISDSDGELIDRTFEPEYARSEPAGEGCGFCDYARDVTIL